jgi:hypothetical protein
MIEPFAVGMQAATRARIKPGDIAVVLGERTVALAKRFLVELTMAHALRLKPQMRTVSSTRSRRGKRALAVLGSLSPLKPIVDSTSTASSLRV